MEKTVIHRIDAGKRDELIKTCYGLIGCIQEVHKQLGAGLPEYIYQEALSSELTENGFVIHKEYEYHPVYKGKAMKTYLKMDLVVENGTDKIIIECKAIPQLTEREHFQLFGYLRGTRWPIGILANFGTSPKAQVERYYQKEGEILAF